MSLHFGWCSFCGCHDGESAGGIKSSRLNRNIGICAPCCRRIIREFGEIPDPTDGVIDLASRRAVPLAPLIRIPGAD